MKLTDEEIDWRKRHLQSIKNLDDATLLFAYSWGYKDPNLESYDKTVKAVLDERLFTKLFQAVKDLNSAAEQNQVEVQRLAFSSITMEALTKDVKTLTIWLLVLTVVAVLSPIAIEVWKAKREIDAPVAPLVLPPLQLTAP